MLWSPTKWICSAALRSSLAIPNLSSYLPLTSDLPAILSLAVGSTGASASTSVVDVHTGGGVKKVRVFVLDVQSTLFLCSGIWFQNYYSHKIETCSSIFNQMSKTASLAFENYPPLSGSAGAIGSRLGDGGGDIGLVRLNKGCRHCGHHLFGQLQQVMGVV